jgi:hypothetical protein
VDDNDTWVAFAPIADGSMAEIQRRRIPAADYDANALTRSWKILTAKKAGGGIRPY